LFNLPLTLEIRKITAKPWKILNPISADLENTIDE
jgi:hypothetical protein